MEIQEKSQIDLDDLTKNLIENIENILNLLGIEEYNIYPNRISFPCPIHGGDNEEGCCIYTDGESATGNWVCWTRHCQMSDCTINGKKEKLGFGLLGFIRALIGEKGKPVPYIGAINWAKKALDKKVKPRTLWQPKHKQQEKVKKKVEIVGTIGREKIRSFLKIPCSYYLELEKPYSKEILDKYDVGLCTIKNSKMFLRAVSPVYDNNFKFIGCCGRSTQPHCEKCNLYHFANRKCPTNKIEKKWARKWINSEGPFAGHSFYNGWYAIPHIYNSNTAILVEGAGDVWRLEEAGVHNSLGVFKSMIGEGQIDLLKKMPISNVILAFDNDKAGRDGIELGIKKLSSDFNVYTVLPESDWGEASKQDILDRFSPVFRKIGIK